MWKRIFVAAVGLAVAAASAWGLWIWAQENQRIERVLVAARDIPAYTVISSDDLGWIDAPAGSKGAGTVQDPREIVNKIALAPLYKGEQIRKERLGDSPLAVGPQERLVGLPYNPAVAVGGEIAPGDRVDLYWVRREDVPAVPVAEDAVVVKLSGSKQGVIEGMQEALRTPPGEEKSAQGYVVVKVKSAEVPNLARALSGGMIVMAKRGAGAR